MGLEEVAVAPGIADEDAGEIVDVYGVGWPSEPVEAPTTTTS